MLDTIVIKDEKSAWALLQTALTEGHKLEFKHIRFEGWPNLQVHVEGRGLNASVPGRYLPALQEYQEGIQRVYSYVKYGVYGIQRLKDAEKKQLEIVYTVGEGSSNFLGPIGDALQNIGSEAIAKMTGKQIVIIIALLALMYGSHAGFTAWLEHKEKLANIAHQDSVVAALVESNKSAAVSTDKHIELLAAAIQESRYGRMTFDSVDEAHSRLVSSMDDEDELVVGEVKVKGKELKQATATPRVKSEDFSASGAAVLLSVDNSVSDGYTIGVKMEDGEIFYAKIQSNRLTPEEMACVKDAIFSRKPIWVHVEGKLKHQKVKDSFIYSARLLTEAEMKKVPKHLGAA